MTIKKQSKSEVKINRIYLLLILLFVIVGLVLGWKLANKSKNSSDASNKIKTSKLNVCTYLNLEPQKFQDISKFVDTQSCRSMSADWKTEKNSTYGFTMKKPGSFIVYESMGAVDIYPDVKKYPEGFLADIGTLNGSFSENMCNLADIGHIAKDSSMNKYYFNKTNGRYFVVGGNYFIVGGGISHGATMMAFNWNNNEMINDEVKCFLSFIEN